MTPRKPSQNPITPTPPPPQPNLPLLVLTLEEAAEVLHCGRSTMFEMVNAGKIRTVQVGRKRLVPVKEIERFLEENTV